MRSGSDVSSELICQHSMSNEPVKCLDFLVFDDRVNFLTTGFSLSVSELPCSFESDFDAELLECLVFVFRPAAGFLATGGIETALDSLSDSLRTINSIKIRKSIRLSSHSPGTGRSTRFGGR